jgi:hypothetical protein
MGITGILLVMAIVLLLGALVYQIFFEGRLRGLFRRLLRDAAREVLREAPQMRQPVFLEEAREARALENLYSLYEPHPCLFDGEVEMADIPSQLEVDFHARQTVAGQQIEPARVLPLTLQLSEGEEQFRAAKLRWVNHLYKKSQRGSPEESKRAFDCVMKAYVDAQADEPMRAMVLELAAPLGYSPESAPVPTKDERADETPEQTAAAPPADATASRPELALSAPQAAAVEELLD